MIFLNKRHRKWTHSWTVHSGILSGIWPLFSRLQSTSSSEHEQGGGHVRVSAPHPRCWRLENSATTTMKPARMRGCCVEKRIFYPTQPPAKHERKKNPSGGDDKSKRRRNHQCKKNNKKNPQICFNLLGRSLYPIPGCCADRAGEV